MRRSGVLKQLRWIHAGRGRRGWREGGRGGKEGGLFSLGWFPFGFQKRLRRGIEVDAQRPLRGFRDGLFVCLFVCSSGNDEDISPVLHASYRRHGGETAAKKKKKRTSNNSLNRHCSGRVGLIMQNRDLLLKETFSKNLLPMSR